jgi:hypothetical protein
LAGLVKYGMGSWLEIAQSKRLAALGAGVVLVLATWVLWSLFAPHPDLVIEAVRKQGYPVSLAELDAWYPSVPPAENAALIYTNAFGLLRNSAGPNTQFMSWLPPIGQGLSPEEESELQTVLASNQAALRLLYSVPPAGRSRYPTRLADGFNALLPHLAKTKDAVALLSAEALLHATHGDAEKATQAFLVAGRVAGSLGDEPTIISQLVRYADWAILLPRLERALSLTTFTDTQLASLQKMVEGAERPRALARAMAVERATGLSAFADRKIMGMVLPPAQGWGGQVLDFFTAVGLLRAAGLQQKDKAFYCDRMARHIAALELPYPARAAAARQLAAITNAPNRFYVFSQLLLPALVRAHVKEANHAALVRAGAAALAVERFRLAHSNALPDSVEQLTPTCCETVPTDPCDGKPLRYKTHGASYVVYSIGSDGQDDGGVAWDSNYLKVPQDVGFVVKR